MALAEIPETELAATCWFFVLVTFCLLLLDALFFIGVFSIA